MDEKLSDIYVTQKELAAFTGLTQRSVTQMTTDGLFVKKKGVYHLQTSVQAYISKMQAKTQGRGAGGDEKTRLTKAQADKTELEVLEKKKILVNKEEFNKELFKLFGVFKAKILALPNKMTIQILGMSEYGEIQDYIKNQLYECLEELSKYDQHKQEN